MKKWIWIGLTAVLLGGGLWAGHLTWRARHDVVSLDVSNASLDQVINSLQRQTRETIVADTNLHAKISLHLRNVSLSEALNRVAAQAGALVGAFHAVYHTDRSLAALKTALRHGQAVETAGWTNLAPLFDMPGHFPKPPAGPLALGSPPPGAVQMMTEDVQIAGPGPHEGPASAPGAHHGKEPGGPPMMVMRFQRSDGAGNTKVEMWSPERIVAQSELVQGLSGALPTSPSRTDAEAAASRLRAHCQTIYALKRAPRGMDILMGAPSGQPHRKTFAGGSGSPPPGHDVGARIQRDKLAQYQDLTPQQRVERMRQLKSNIEQRN
jgi:hypothetical protein